MENNFFDDVCDFQRTVLRDGRELSDLAFRKLSAGEKEFALTSLREEINELEAANGPGDQADALLDLIYFAFGNLFRMGMSRILVNNLWKLVHKANMQKVLGPTKRGFSVDAQKPEGWIPPQETTSGPFRLFEKAMDIQKKKGQDYNRGKVKFEDYFPFGHKSYVHMLHLKALRLVSLVEDTSKPPNFDSVEDTILDLAVYADKYYCDLVDGKIE